MNKESKRLPLLMTERLTLRQISQNDAGEIFQLRSNPEINKFLDRQPSKIIEDALIFIKSIIENENDDFFYWAITKTGEEKLIGTICLFGFLDDLKKCEIGYELLTEYQGKGFMIEAVKKIIQYGTATLELETIDAVIHKNNQNSIGLLQKLGFKELENSNEQNPNLTLFRLMK
ncbi:GNAT family N-acetyltransferase [Flavobacterium sp. W22_SRS_FK3]|uniref:GNAT family N-acetyltransferase n=1 Tax=Flavobacterium sp. W22_SRS_FK3 TaxID=3240275 RepID=UPI003F90C82E